MTILLRRITRAVAAGFCLAGTLLFAPLAVAQDEAASEPVSEECLKFAADINADLGEVLKAGCEPTLAQMSTCRRVTWPMIDCVLHSQMAVAIWLL